MKKEHYIVLRYQLHTVDQISIRDALEFFYSNTFTTYKSIRMYQNFEQKMLAYIFKWRYHELEELMIHKPIRTISLQMWCKKYSQHINNIDLFEFHKTPMWSEMFLHYSGTSKRDYDVMPVVWAIIVPHSDHHYAKSKKTLSSTPKQDCERIWGRRFRSI